MSRTLPQLTPAQVKEARRLLGWQQADLAAAVGLSIGTIGRLERGYGIQQGTRIAIAKALSAAGVAVDAQGHLSLPSPRPAAGAPDDQASAAVSSDPDPAA